MYLTFEVSFENTSDKYLKNIIWNFSNIRKTLKIVNIYYSKSYFTLQQSIFSFIYFRKRIWLLHHHNNTLQFMVLFGVRISSMVP